MFGLEVEDCWAVWTQLRHWEEPLSCCWKFAPASPTGDLIALAFLPASRSVCLSVAQQVCPCVFLVVGPRGAVGVCA